jgi:glucose/arabinose dehydrogenase
VPGPDAGAALVPPGYLVEAVLAELTYPTSVEFDDAGAMYVAEAGYSYGDPTPKPRILRVSREGKVETLAHGEPLNGPVNDLLWHQGRMFVSHRGKISVLEGNGRVRDVVTGLPSAGDHHTNQMTAGRDGKIYFGQGTATNSGVVGIDNYKMGWLKDHPNFHDVPAREVTLRGRTFETPNPLTGTQDQVRTSPFHPFTKAATQAAVVKGQTKASGTILRVSPDGADLEVYAWGLRNPFGVMWSPDGTLYATENGLDVRGSRPVANDKEDIYVVKEGAWYGWPDYAMGLPLTDGRFKPEGKPQPQFLMADHPPLEKPWTTFPKHAAIAKLDFAPSERFGKGQMFVAFFGHMTPMTGKPPEEHGGHRVVRIDPATKKVETFFTKKGHEGHGQAQGRGGGHHGGGGGQQESVTAGPRRLVDVRFSPDGQSLYIADFGSMVVGEKPKPIPGTGVIWRVVPEAAQPSGPPAGLSAPR